MPIISYRKLRHYERRIFDVRHRDFLPILIPVVVIGGLALVGRKYIIRTLERMREEDEIAAMQDDEADNQNPIKIDLKRSSFGVDIGSTYARIALHNGDSVAILENREGKHSTPCYAMQSDVENEFTVGNIARNSRYIKSGQVLYGGHLMIGLEMNDPFVQSLSKDLPDIKISVTSTSQLNLTTTKENIQSTPNKLYTLYSKHLCEIAFNKLRTASVTSIIASVPNFYSNKQKEEVKKSIEQNGKSMHVSHVLHDSVCTIIGAYHLKYLNTTNNSGNYLIIDFGGRLVQLSIVHIGENGIEMTKHLSLLHIGSDHIDVLLAHHLAKEFDAKHNSFILNDPMSKQRFIDAMEVAKLELSSGFSTRINIPYITSDKYGQPIHYEHTLTRHQLEQIIQPMIFELQCTLKQLLLNANIGLDTIEEQLKHCYVVGGGARLPLIMEAVTQTIGMAPVKMAQPEEIVCIGAAAYSKYFM